MKAFASFVCLVAVIASACAEDVKVVAKQNYAAQDRAIEHRDPKEIDAVMRPRVTSDFKAESGGQTVDYKGYMANVRDLFKQFPKVSSSSSKIESCKVAGKTATLRVNAVLIATAVGPDRKSHTVKIDNLSEDIWKNVGGKWKCASSTTLNQTMRVDGKVFKPRPQVVQ